ncbi:MAG: tyrosine-type recombinase/integrase [Planctomycetes bacterium]|nr:tyrosine-type recombinase/integrase [Planctomycetota bacterium]
MSKPRKNVLVRCQHFQWRLTRRGGVWQADGRSNTPGAGRHSLGTGDRDEAMENLAQLDALIAAKLGLAPLPVVAKEESTVLTLEEGRRLYEEHIQRPRVAGGVRASTQKRYRSVFDKFVPWAKSNGILSWNAVTKKNLHDYASYLEKLGYAGKTLRNELTVLVQTIKWLVEEKHLPEDRRIRLKFRKVESQSAYCYHREHVEAMVAYCGQREALLWLKRVIVALACTGLRIAELAMLRWSDIDNNTGYIILPDESGQADDAKAGNRRETKGGCTRRLRIHPDLAAVLSEMPRSADGYVFHGPRGGRLKPDTVRRILVSKVLTPLTATFPSAPGERGFKDGRLHSFRHFFCSMCASQGVAERVLMAWLGHASSDMIKIYFHLHDTESRQQMDKLNLLGTAGMRPTGTDNRAAQCESEDPPSQESNGEPAPEPTE